MRITDYDFGRIVVDGETHTSDVIIYPGEVRGSWRREEGHRLSVADLEPVWSAQPEILVIGTGYYKKMVIPEETLEHARSRGIEIVSAATPEAVDIFNKLQSDSGKKVIAAFHLTC